MMNLFIDVPFHANVEAARSRTEESAGPDMDVDVVEDAVIGPVVDAVVEEGGPDVIDSGDSDDSSDEEHRVVPSIAVEGAVAVESEEVAATQQHHRSNESECDELKYMRCMYEVLETHGLRSLVFQKQLSGRHLDRVGLIALLLAPDCCPHTGALRSPNCCPDCCPVLDLD